MDHQIITFECAFINCPKVIENEDGIPLCSVYVDPAAVQHRMGRTNACGIIGNTSDNTIAQGKIREGQKKTKRNR